MSDDPDWIDELYAEGAKAVPPPALDEKIRAAARQNVRPRWYRTPGRLAALATAASLVIAVSVIYLESGPSQLEGQLERQMKDQKKDQMRDQMKEQPEVMAPDFAPAPLQSAGFDEDRSVTLEERLADRHEREAVGAAADTAARRQLKSEVAQARSMPDRNVENMAAGTYADTLAAAPIALAEMEVAAELTELCGALPGAAETREILSDESGWLVQDTVGGDVRTWRCVDGAWIETPSQQQ